MIRDVIDANFIVESVPLTEEDTWIFQKTLSVPPNRPVDDESPEFKEWQKGIVRTNDPVTVLPANATMFDVLAQAGIFSSKSDARKNWKGVVEIPWGWSEFTVGKLKHQVFIWKMRPANVPEPLPNSRVEDKRIDNIN